MPKEIPQSVWLDTDIGDDTDDILALSLICASPELKLAGVSTVLGETENRARLARTLLASTAGPYARLRVAAGGGHPLPGRVTPDIWPNGPVARPWLVQLPCARPASALPRKPSQHGMDLLAAHLRRHPRKTIPIGTGPMTNLATLLLREAGGEVTTDYDAIVTETVGDLKLRFLARDFFQNNPFILPAFTGYVRSQAAASGARFLVDAYCGSGLFALTAASAFEQVAGIELSASSIAFAKENAAANGIANAVFQAGDASAIFHGLTFPAADTAVVIDPPRKGCDAAFLTQLFAFRPRTVVYVSCDPATQMRDLKEFLAAGYTLTAVQPFDLFPQTRHLECVITLRRP